MAASSTPHRRRLVRALGLAPGPVADAFAAVPREAFVPEWVERIGLAKVYERDAVLVTQHDANGTPTSSSSAPSIMASMLEALDVRAGHRVLEIGAGTGYNAALLDHLVGRRGRVVTIELDPETAARARAALREVGARARVVVGDGHAGHARGGPYDRIIATAASPTVPRAWFDQLVDGGLVELPYQRVGLGAVPTLAKRGDRLTTVSVVLGGFMSMRSDVADPGRRHDQLSVSSVADGTESGESLLGGRVAQLSRAGRRRLHHLLVDGPRVSTWRRAANPIGYLLLAERATCQYAGWRGWGAAVVAADGGRAAAVVRSGDRGTRVLHWGPGADDLLDRALAGWRRRREPTLADLRLTVDYPDGEGARIRHHWAVSSGQRRK